MEWFRFAHTEVDEVSPLSQVVMMSTAFEILLDVPNTQRKADWIANRIQELCCEKDSITETRPVEGKKVTRAKAAWFAWDFYKLRNSIVHGDKIIPSDFSYAAPDRDWLNMLIVADMLFGECVIWALEKNKLCGRKGLDYVAGTNKAFGLGKRGLKFPDGVRWAHGLEDHHRALGWKPELLSKAKIGVRPVVRRPAAPAPPAEPPIT